MSGDFAGTENIKYLAQAYVTNLREPTGELVGAAVVTRGALTAEDLDREARARLSAFKVPKRWVLLGSPADVPTMATGKVDKARLQELLRRGERSAGEGPER